MLDYKWIWGFSTVSLGGTRKTLILYKEENHEWSETKKSIQTLVEKNQTRGHHTVDFDADHLASGIYFYQLKVGSEHMDTKKMVLMR